ncbi:MAG: hypothetical protein ACPG6V_04940 [Flavobacteriales bacterium]
MNEERKFQLLKETLFQSETEQLTSHTKALDDLRSQVDDFRDEASGHIQQRIEATFVDFKERFPTEYSGVITEAIKKQIHEAKDEVVDALYPIMGRLIKAFIEKEIEKIVESVDQKVNNTFTLENIKLQFKSFFTGAKVGDQVLKDSVSVPKIEQVFLLEAESGMLISSFTATSTLDEDMIAAMLTAITDFGEDTLIAKNENLKWVEFDLHKIHTQNFGRFDIALVISGIPNTNFTSDIDDTFHKFFEGMKYDQKEAYYDARLEEHFKDFI